MDLTLLCVLFLASPFRCCPSVPPSLLLFVWLHEVDTFVTLCSCSPHQTLSWASTPNVTMFKLTCIHFTFPTSQCVTQTEKQTLWILIWSFTSRHVQTGLWRVTGEDLLFGFKRFSCSLLSLPSGLVFELCLSWRLFLCLLGFLLHCDIQNCVTCVLLSVFNPYLWVYLAVLLWQCEKTLSLPLSDKPLVYALHGGGYLIPALLFSLQLNCNSLNLLKERLKES